MERNATWQAHLLHTTFFSDISELQTRSAAFFCPLSLQGTWPSSAVHTPTIYAPVQDKTSLFYLSAHIKTWLAFWPTHERMATFYGQYALVITEILLTVGLLMATVSAIRAAVYHQSCRGRKSAVTAVQ